jgi:dTDP-glucose 4,6-dehydratase
MIYFSTDEVFGPAPVGVNYKEWDRYKSSNPYAASKAGGEELCIAFHNTYNVPVLVTHTMNVFGERQHMEKFIPKVIRCLLLGETVVIHSDKTKSIPGSRFWIHARNVAAAVWFLMKKGEPGDKYNIVGEEEVNNLQMALDISYHVQKKLKYEMVDFHSSRPGHDLRYALDGTKLKEMGFSYPKSFEESLGKTVRWTLENPKWLGFNDGLPNS